MKKVLILVVLGLVIALVGCNTETIDFAQNSCFSLKSVVTKIDTSIAGNAFIADSVYISWAIQTPTQGEGLAIFKSQDSTSFPTDPETTYVYGRINSYMDVTDVNPLETYFYRITLPTNNDIATVYTLTANMRDTLHILSPLPGVDTNFICAADTDTVMSETLKIQFRVLPDVYRYNVALYCIDTTVIISIDTTIDTTSVPVDTTIDTTYTDIISSKQIWARQDISVPDTSDVLPYTPPPGGTEDPVVYDVDSLTNDTLFTLNFTGADGKQSELVTRNNTKYIIKVDAIYRYDPVIDPNVLSFSVINNSIGFTSFKTTAP